jgi:hypothetical protein
MLTFLKTFTWKPFQAQIRLIPLQRHSSHANSGLLRTILLHSEFHQSKVDHLSMLFSFRQSFSFGPLILQSEAFDFVVIFCELLKFILGSLKLLSPFDHLLQILTDLFWPFFSSMIHFKCLVINLVSYEYWLLTLLDQIDFNEIEEF